MDKVVLKILRKQRIDDENNIYNQLIQSDASYNAKESEYVKPLIEKYEKELAKNMAEYVFKNKKYNSLMNGWLSLEVYRPISVSQYSFAPTLGTAEIADYQLRPWELKGVGGIMYQRKKYKLIVSAFASISNLNTAMTKTIKKYNFYSFIDRSSENQNVIDVAQEEDKSVYVGIYDEFVLNRFGAEVVFFTKFDIGISSKLEYYDNFNNFNGFNWKIGMPISGTNDEGKAKVNFEIQYKSDFGNNSFGVAVGLPFGKMLVD